MKSRRGIDWRAVAVVLAVLASALPAYPAIAPFVTFESGQVRPLALSPDGTHLFAVNTPDNRLEVFRVYESGLTYVASVAVGLEPVAVAARTNTEVWVVNHLSDSVSVVEVGPGPARVVRTLLVGDEPRDIVFAGPRAAGAFTRAFITTARRGQNLPPSVPPKLTDPGTPRALLWVFDATDLGAALGGAPETIVELFGDTPRALATTADGSTVYAAIFHSGNQTTSISEGAVCNGGAAVAPCTLDGIQVPGGLPNGRVPGGLPAPNLNYQGIMGPETGLIVQLNRGNGLWEDRLGRNWTNAVRFNLPDLDVFTINALANPPRQSGAVAHVGTVLFNMAVNPANGKVYVSNTDAKNEVRFEGPGNSATTVRGHLHEARISVIDGNNVVHRHLNKHISAQAQGYRTVPMPLETREASLAIPLDMAVGSDGKLYVAAFGSSVVGVFDTAALEDGSFAPSTRTQIALTGGGPAGLALDESRHLLFVLTRFDNAIKIVDTSTNTEIGAVKLHNPEPGDVVQGRPFLYDARSTSSNGEASCASCHVFGDFDSLAWDLGNPDDAVMPSPNPRGPLGGNQPFHPLKGPMTTQTLRGMANHGPMHWRGDRTGGTFQGDPLALDEQKAFETFNVAFEGLLGRDQGQLDEADMSAFARFAVAIVSPPNPIRSLDNQLTPAQANGRDIYFNRPATDGVAACNGCHTLDPAAGFFGGEGRTTFENEPQEMKVAHLRNAYQKIGMFGMPDVAFVEIPAAKRQHQGDQLRGFGYLHDGSIATVNDFMHATVFFLSEQERADIEQFVLAFDTTFAPIVGQQVTLTGSNGGVANPRIDLLVARARTSFALVDQPGARECDLVVNGIVDGAARGYLLDAGSGRFQSDRAAEPPIGDAQLRALAGGSGQELTFTCVPPGSGMRIGLDRDGDSFFDRDEIDAGSDPADAADTPGGQPTPTPTSIFTPTPTPSPFIDTCVGDCNADGLVTIDEIILGVGIALGDQPQESCPLFDANHDDTVTVDELLQGVQAALGLDCFSSGCERVCVAVHVCCGSRLTSLVLVTHSFAPQG